VEPQERKTAKARTVGRNGRAVWLAVAIAIAEAISAPSRAEEPGPPAPRRTLDVFEFRVEGVTRLSNLELEAALNPFLGPARTLEDVEKARAALEKAYADKGYQSVAVAIPQQTVRDGVVTLQVTEPVVGRLRVRGARWFLPSDVGRLAPSVAEGTVPNFNDLVQDVVALNQLPDRRVTPALRAGRVPGTIDVDLDVQDTFPLHGLLELNDRHGRDTSDLRSTASLRYDNLWQLGHTLSVTAQLAPERLADARVIIASYTARFSDVPWLSVLGMWIEHASDVSTLAGINVKGNGRSVGGRLQAVLPGSAGFFHLVSAGVDYKTSQERLLDGINAISSPITYVPFGAEYTAAWTTDRSQTQLVASFAANLRPLSSSAERFRDKAYGASASFVVLRAEANRTDRLPLDLEVATRLQGQWTDDPLVGSEQIGAGGAESVRGYLESEAVGDYGGLASLELRSPPLARLWQERGVKDWRVRGFVDAAWVAVRQPLPEQQKASALSAFGAETELRFPGSLAGTVGVAFPLRAAAVSRFLEARLFFRAWWEF
jgi:hemolysin activation/secretion protein